MDVVESAAEKFEIQYSPEDLEAVVPAELAGLRLDAAAAQMFPAFSRARIKTLIEDGLLMLNGLPHGKTRTPVKTGDFIELAPLPVLGSRLVAQDIALDVVYQDAHVLVLNKPSGFTVHPGAGMPDGTLQNALLYHFPQTEHVPRNGLIHRLDRHTTGLMVVALSEAAHTVLTAAMAQRKIRREYDALVNGALVVGGTVNEPIARHPRERVRMAVVMGGRPAVTHFRVAERFEGHTLLRVQLETGRTHQIRVHLSHLKYPVTGDSLYGGNVQRIKNATPGVKAALHGFGRQALHAAELSFAHPTTGKIITNAAPRPADFENLLAVLRRESPCL